MAHLELIILIAVSWILIRFFDSDSHRKGNLSVLGLKPTKSRLLYAAILFFVTAFCCATGFFMRMYFADEEFGLNPEIDFGFVLSGIWVVLVSVLFEELLCRGVGLYI